VYNGVTYFTSTAAAEILGRSYRTLTRLEKDGVIPKPPEVEGHPGQRLYTQQDLDNLAKLVAESGFAERGHGSKGRLKGLVDSLGAIRPRPSFWDEQEVTKRPRQFGRRPDPDDDPGDWMPPAERRLQEPRREEPLPEAILCPTCKVEAVWIIQQQPGGGIVQLPICDKHGPIDLAPPPVDPTQCPHCGLELVLDAGASMQPICEVCGPVEVPTPPSSARGRRRQEEEQPWQHQVSFSTVTVDKMRPRGLTERDVVGAVRMARPQPGPRISFVPMPEGPTRPA
jgi:hypothetical protein